MGVTCSTCFENTKGHEKRFSVGNFNKIVEVDTLDMTEKNEETVKVAKNQKKVIEPDYIHAFSTNSKLLNNLIKLQALVRTHQYKKRSSTLREFYKHKKDRRKEEFQSVFDFEPFNIYGWKAFYENSPNPQLDESKLLYKEIVSPYSYYYGQVDQHGKPYGYGVLKEKEGKKSEGYWTDGKMNGWCRVTSKRGECFEGLFKNSVLNGKGRKINLNGDYYEGDFVDGNKHGVGVEETVDQKYEGEFQENQKEGKATVVYKNKGRVYTGSFKNNAINGNGKLTYDSGDYYEGEFQENQMHGIGKYVWKDGSSYEGEYFNGEKTGKGLFVWPDGRTYRGQFLKGVPHGSGLLKVKGNKQYDAVFEKGKLKEKTLIK